VQMTTCRSYRQRAERTLLFLETNQTKLTKAVSDKDDGWRCSEAQGRLCTFGILCSDF